MNIQKVPYSKAECSGCTACVNICPVKAISMKEDEEGFKYPFINEEKCINCGLCGRKCSFINEMLENNKEKHCFYLAKNLDNKDRLNSQSGGVFAALSEWILEQNGIIYGCILDEKNNAIHIRGTTQNDKEKMCKSKYVQSDLKNTFELVYKDLKNNYKVLFSGTGCQVAGLITYLENKKIKKENLYTVDIICHGCASPKMFADYKKWLEDKYSGSVKQFNFRDKSVSGWDGHVETFIINNRKHKKTIYRELFHTDAAIRPSCYNCKFSKVNRKSDITIGDAWGIKNNNINFHDNIGESIFILHGNKDEQLLSILKEKCEILKVSSDKYMQKNLMSPSECKINRDIFWKEYKEKGFDYIVNKYGKLKISKRIKEWSKYKIRKIIQGKKYYLP